MEHTSHPPADIAIIGLGVMGTSLARNFRSRGQTVAVFDVRDARRAEFITEYGAEGDGGRFVVCDDYASLLTAFQGAPARMLLMVTAGKVVDLVLEALAPVLAARPSEGGRHIVIDGGNSHFPNTERRVKWADERGFSFFGMGVSGGEKGALEGPSMMPGGDKDSWEILGPVLTPAAAVSDSGPCVTWCGYGSAGHFVKMVHNGIEYGDMQLIAEVYGLMSAMGHTPQQMRTAFQAYNSGPLASYLIEITADIVGARDPQGDGPLVAQILDVAGQKGTGRWTSISAIELGVPVPTVTAAVDGRALSAMKAVRERADVAFPTPDYVPVLSDDVLGDALYAAKLMSYTQGFALLRAGSEARGYETDLPEIARIWKAGCIIRAAFLDRVYDAFKADPDLPSLALSPDFAQDLTERIPALRTVVREAIAAGRPVPGLSASLAYFDTLAHGRGTASVIQAQRDYFGAHTYRRFDAPETPVHSQWEDLDQL
ncbi:MAG: NADP-dependent phosphogluconate dehydrogenase [Bradymonadia bacterium]